MHDRFRALIGEDPLDELAVGDRAFVEPHILGYDLAGAVAEVVDHRDRPSRVFQRQDGVAADIAGAASDEHGTLVMGKALAEDGPLGQRRADQRQDHRIALDLDRFELPQEALPEQGLLARIEHDRRQAFDVFVAKGYALEPKHLTVNRPVGALPDHFVHPDRRCQPCASRILARQRDPVAPVSTSIFTVEPLISTSA